MITIPSFAATLTVTILGQLGQPADKVENADWGAIARQRDTEIVILAVDDMPASGELLLPRPVDWITGAYVDEPGRVGPGKMPRVTLEYRDGGNTIGLRPPAEAGKACTIVVETVTSQKKDLRHHIDGRVVLGAGGATIVPAPGAEKAMAVLRSDGLNERIGFWSQREESLMWEWIAPRPGMYDIELTYALNDKPSTIRAAVGEETVEAELESTAGEHTFRTVKLGNIYLKSPVRHRLTLTKLDGRLVSVKAVTLRPTGEGKPIKQAEDGSIVLHARDVTIHGTKVQYEPKPEKNTVGYWVNESDKVFWTFTVTRPGTFEVEILQGCGKGQGGSEVALSLLERTGFGRDQSLKFIVEDTGHFQNFIPRTIGKLTIDKAGEHTIEVRPIKKAKAAVMDLRQVKLNPGK